MKKFRGHTLYAEKPPHFFLNVRSPRKHFFFAAYRPVGRNLLAPSREVNGFGPVRAREAAQILLAAKAKSESLACCAPIDCARSCTGRIRGFLFHQYLFLCSATIFFRFAFTSTASTNLSTLRSDVSTADRVENSCFIPTSRIGRPSRLKDRGSISTILSINQQTGT